MLAGISENHGPDLAATVRSMRPFVPAKDIAVSEKFYADLGFTVVDDLSIWWEHIAKLDLAAQYGVSAPRPPKRESWGLDVVYVVDPSGVLWHIAQDPNAV